MLICIENGSRIGHEGMFSKERYIISLAPFKIMICVWYNNSAQDGEGGMNQS